MASAEVESKMQDSTRCTKANMDSAGKRLDRLDRDAKVDNEGGCAVPFPGLVRI